MYVLNGKYYKKTAMARKIAPVYANLFMGKLEKNKLAHI